MSSSITERILGNNNIYTDKYYKDTILLTKSIVVVSSVEAKLYNDLLTEQLGATVNLADKTTWRYYLHLTGNYHPIDRPVVLVSIDSGTEITLDKVTVEVHRATRDSLLRFDHHYKELIDKYPDQELLIKSILNKSKRKTVEEVIDLEDYTIVSYNSDLVEEHETNLVPQLQIKIDNYKVTKMLPYYATMESYFMASMYDIFYKFILTTLIAIRLGNAKTQMAHSYHILNYLASHHGLDRYYNYLTKKQTLFLYRNLLYLNNHSGRNHIFKLLIQKLFTDKRVSIVNYRQKQKNSTTTDGKMEYRFNQVLLNDDNLVYDPSDFSLSELKDREVDLIEGNVKEYRFNEELIDFRNRNGLFSQLITKDLEINLVDNSNDVKHKLLETIIDYWAHMLAMGKHNVVSSIVDPVTNNEYNLFSGDMFKLFTIILHKANNVTLDHFPDFASYRVYKSPLPSLEELQSKMYNPAYTIRKISEKVRAAVPEYPMISTPYSYNLFITKVYNLNLGLWIYTSSQGDKDINAQLDQLVENLHERSVYSFNNETPEAFLLRIGFSNVLGYNEKVLIELIANIINAISYNKIGELNRNKFVQEALVQVFKQFNSYTTQIIDKYSSSEAILANLKSPLYTVDVDKQSYQYYLHSKGDFVDLVTVKLDNISVNLKEVFSSDLRLNTEIQLDLSETTDHNHGIDVSIRLEFLTPGIVDAVEDQVVESLPDQETLLFLSSVM